MRATIIVLAKTPVPGRVKTRLCPPCTPKQAARIAAAALADTLDAVRETPSVRRVLAIDGPLTAAGFATVRQRGGDLGDRIANAFADTGTVHSGSIFQIGMDTPQLSPELLQHGLAELDRTDAVLGPAYDGGWWALGLRKPAHASVLRRVPMSTPQTGKLTVRALQDAGLSLRLLPPLSDVDTAADAQRVAAQAPDGRFAQEVGAVL